MGKDQALEARQPLARPSHYLAPDLCRDTILGCGTLKASGPAGAGTGARGSDAQPAGCQDATLGRQSWAHRAGTYLMHSKSLAERSMLLRSASCAPPDMHGRLSALRDRRKYKKSTPTSRKILGRAFGAMAMMTPGLVRTWRGHGVASCDRRNERSGPIRSHLPVTDPPCVASERRYIWPLR